MWQTFIQAWHTRDIRNGLLFVLAMMVIFRIAANIPLPGVDVQALQRLFDASSVLGLLNVFSGGTIRNFSIVALGVAPYITASIIFQLLGMMIPRIEEIQKDGEAGQRKINQWTRLATVPLSIIQGFSLLALLRQSQVGVLENTHPLYLVALMCTVTAGTMFLVWIGELISERKLGNGMSLLIAAGILAELPSTLGQLISSYDGTQIFAIVLYGAIAIATVLGVVFVTEGQRNIPIQHTRLSRGPGVALGGVASSLPLRVNMVGVIPIIFAVSLLIFPTFVSQFLIQARTPAIADAARAVYAALQNQTVYGILYFLLVVGFSYFYTTVVFQPERIAENLQKQGGFVPGIRPGKATSEYLFYVINRITLGGSVFLAIIAVLPIMAQQLAGSQQLALGGTSLLIVVSVVIETVKQIESQLTMRQYDAY